MLPTLSKDMLDAHSCNFLYRLYTTLVIVSVLLVSVIPIYIHMSYIPICIGITFICIMYIVHYGWYVPRVDKINSSDHMEYMVRFSIVNEVSVIKYFIDVTIIITLLSLLIGYLV